MSDTSGYSRLQIALHWGVALGVLFNYLVSEGMEDAFDAMVEGEAVAEGAEGFGMPGLHVWVGVVVLVLVVVRLIVRMAQGAPAAEEGIGGTLAKWGHRLLYVGMLAVPALGAITWFGGLEGTADLHVLTANALMIIAAGHTLMALYHQYVVKDGLLDRMTRPR